MARNDFRQNGPIFITEHFDTFWSVIDNCSECPFATKIRAFDVLYESIDKMVKDLSDELKVAQMSDEHRLDLANMTKMLVYLLVNIVKVIDTEMNNSGNDAKGKKVSN